MNFREDLKLEETFYDEVFKDYMRASKLEAVFIRYGSPDSVYSYLQKKKDIDIIADDGIKNRSYSLKTVHEIYPLIFIETISNTNTNSPGWGYYSEADWTVFTMGWPAFRDDMETFFFRIADVRILDWDRYKKGYGKTINDKGELMYRTEGRLIPPGHFQHKRANLCGGDPLGLL